MRWTILKLWVFEWGWGLKLNSITDACNWSDIIYDRFTQSFVNLLQFTFKIALSKCLFHNNAWGNFKRMAHECWHLLGDLNLCFLYFNNSYRLMHYILSSKQVLSSFCSYMVGLEADVLRGILKYCYRFSLWRYLEKLDSRTFCLKTEGLFISINILRFFSNTWTLEFNYWVFILVKAHVFIYIEFLLWNFYWYMGPLEVRF